jgi:hypothetical protein
MNKNCFFVFLLMLCASSFMLVSLTGYAAPAPLRKYKSSIASRYRPVHGLCRNHYALAVETLAWLKHDKEVLDDLEKKDLTKKK